jgi:predicted CXXCH cytochrome family protein
MNTPDIDSVKAPFNGEKLVHFNDTYSFYKKNKNYVINHNDKEYKVEYTFGHYPLQQYLVDFGSGKFQVLTASWSLENKNWYEVNSHLSKEDYGLAHWKGYLNNWNQRCASCHSTDLKKNYSFEKNEYKTTYLEENVSCLACHKSPGDHIEWANGSKSLKNKGFDHSLETYPPVISPKNSKKTFSITDSTISNKCFSCHGLRGEIESPKKGFLNSHSPRIVSDDLYELDGQIKEEAFVMGSFTQSKMFHKGVNCLHCHNPHSGKLKKKGNNLCLQCHDTSYQTYKHSKHKVENARCIDCHMPSKTYMKFDERRDHKFVIPRPDYSLKYGISNSCTSCHSNYSKEKLSKVFKQNFPKLKTKDNLLEAIGSIKNGEFKSSKDLLLFILNPNYPEMKRAYAVSYLSRFTISDEVIYKEIYDTNSYLIHLALKTHISNLQELGNISKNILVKMALSKHDSLSYEALYQLAMKGFNLRKESELKIRFENYLSSLVQHSDYPDNVLKLAALSSVGLFSEASNSLLKDNIQKYPRFLASYVNLADHFRALKNDKESLDVLNSGLKLSSKDSSLLVARGLLYIRTKKYSKALSDLKNAHTSQFNNDYYAYLYCLALSSLESPKNALSYLESVKGKYKDSFMITQLLSSLYQQTNMPNKLDQNNQRLKSFR